MYVYIYIYTDVFSTLAKIGYTGRFAEGIFTTTNQSEHEHCESLGPKPARTTNTQSPIPQRPKLKIPPGAGSRRGWLLAPQAPLQQHLRRQSRRQRC